MTQVEIRELEGGNFDLDLIPNPKISWHQDTCPWNEVEGVETHKCVVKNVSICKYFKGIKAPDVVLCAYPK